MGKKKKELLEKQSGEETFEHLHGTPVEKMSRRELLASGLIKFTGAMTLPSLYHLFAQGGVAEAQDIVCRSGGVTDLAPFVTVNLAGGAGLSANFIPHDQGLQPLQSYSKLGLGAAGSFPITPEFKNGAPFAGANLSQFVVGVRETALASTLQNTVFVAVPMRSQDDSSMNRLSLDGMVTKAGRAGIILPTLGQNRNQAAFVTPPNPLSVRSFSSIEGAISVKNSLANLSKNQQIQLFKSVQKLSLHQGAKLVGLSGGQELRSLLHCANLDNTRTVASADPGIDPVKDPVFSALWGIDATTRANAQAYVQAALVYNVIKGNSPTANIGLGGYDYHNGTRTSGDQRDLTAGQLIGRILESFAQSGKRGFLVLTTDGAVTGPESDTPGGIWTSDRGTAGMAYMMAFDPVGKAQASQFQLGHFLGKKDAQAADVSFLTGASPEMAAAGIFANYMSFNGQSGLIEKVIPRVIPNAQMSQILKISG